jgi:3-isopropylmalate dehydrogenase
MHLVMHPQEFDVVLCTNMFGDILSDLTAGLVGGLGLAAGLNVGDHKAMAQATHGSAPDIAGRGIANPYAMILSAGMLLDWLHARHKDDRIGRVAQVIDTAAEQALTETKYLTPDLGGTATTSEVGEAIAELCSSVEPELTDGKG